MKRIPIITSPLFHIAKALKKVYNENVNIYFQNEVNDGSSDES